MRPKLFIIGLFAIAMLLPMAQRAWQQDNGAIITLNVKGARERGAVKFDHQAHQGRINPDATWPYKASATASCSGCHHSSNEVGLPQLWKCTVCHRTEGGGEGKYVNQRCGKGCDTAGNPKNCECDELYFERAFHDSCIGCHRATNEQKQNLLAPVSCSGCHASKQ